MKISKHINYISAAAFGLAMLAMGSCTDNTFDYDPMWVDEEVEAPEEVDPENPTEEEPTYDFTLMSKNVAIDPGTRFQTIDGIGASDCWLPATLGRAWTNNRGRLAELLFSQEIVNGQPKGIGLSTWRVNLGAGTEELGANSGINEDNKYNRAPSYVTGQAGALQYDWSKCPGQRYFMEQAKKMGVESFVMFSNSPLVQFTYNGKGKSNRGPNANLKDDYYDDFADYMATVAEHFVKEGYNISHISPVNEPQYNWNGDNQEGSGWKNAQVAKLARELDKALTDKGISTKISLGEAGHWAAMISGNIDRESTLKAFLDPESDAYVGNLKTLDNISGHSYYTDGNWTDMRATRASLAAEASLYNAKIWQTEWSMLVNGNNHYGSNLNDQTTHWDIAQYMTMVMHNDFVVGNVSAWHFWTAMSVERWSQMDRFMLISCIPPGGNYDNNFEAEGRIEPLRTLWALGNFSRFIRPGYTRIAHSMIETQNFFGTSWISPDGKTIVSVYTNRTADRGIKLKVNYAGWPSKPVSIKRYTTTNDKDLQETVCSVNFPVVCEPSSVTTVVYTLE